MTLTQLPNSSSRVRSDSLSSAAMSDFYEAFDFLNEENSIDDSAPAFYKVFHLFSRQNLDEHRVNCRFRASGKELFCVILF